jgi:hypothetical protein
LSCETEPKEPTLFERHESMAMAESGDEVDGREDDSVRKEGVSLDRREQFEYADRGK